MPLSSSAPRFSHRKRPPHETVRGLADHDCVRCGHPLKARCDVDDGAQRQRLASHAFTEVADDHGSRVDADASREPHTVPRFGRGVPIAGERCDEVEAGTHCTLGIVLVRVRVAKIGQ